MSEVGASPCVIVTLHHLIVLASQEDVCGYKRWKCYMPYTIHLAYG
jgi:hypothetical protein